MTHQHQHQHPPAPWPPPGRPRDPVSGQPWRAALAREMRPLLSLPVVCRGWGVRWGRGWETRRVAVCSYRSGPYGPPLARLRLGCWRRGAHVEVTVVPDELPGLASWIIAATEALYGGEHPNDLPELPIAVKWWSTVRDYGWSSRADEDYCAWYAAWRAAGSPRPGLRARVRTCDRGG